MSGKLPQKRPIRLGALILLLIILVYLGSKFFPFRMVDFTVYWSAGAVYLEGGNPYLPEQLISKQMETGWSREETDLMFYFYPPWTLLIFIPFGILAFQTAQTLWYLGSVSIVLLCARALWLFYKGSPGSILLGGAASLLFAPSIFALTFGQVSPLILLGLTGFLLFAAKNDRRSDLIAGISTGLISLKPTMLFLFWPALLLWCLSRRRGYILLGLASALTVSQLLVTAFRPNILQDFLTFMASAEMTNWGVPTIGSWLRRIFGPNKIWLQFIPPVGGILWFLFFWLKEKDNWDWKEHLAYVCFGSIITTVYTWSHDQVVLIPSILSVTAAFTTLPNSTKGISVKILGIGWGVFNITIFMMHLSRDDSFFIWQAPLILLFYLVAKRLLWQKEARFPTSCQT